MQALGLSKVKNKTLYSNLTGETVRKALLVNILVKEARTNSPSNFYLRFCGW